MRNIGSSRCTVIILAPLIMIGIGLSGCAQLNTAYRSRSIPYQGKENKAVAQIVTVDAKQRHLLIAPEVSGTGSTASITGWRMCAEAAPDAFSAYAASLAAKGSKSGGELSFGSAETAATIERTQTVNVLRESMYRTCERYLSGALNTNEFIIQSARDQRSMVAVLAIEQLTGAIRSKPTIISGPATTASIVDGQKIAELIEEYTGERDKAKKEAAAASDAFDKVKDKGKCEANEKKPDGVETEDWAACTAAKAFKEQKAKDFKTADERLDKVLELANKAITQVQASTSAGTNQGDALTSNKPGDLALVAVAQTIEKIVLSPGIDEPLMFCISYIQANASDPSVVQKCKEIIATRAEDDREVRSKMLGVQLADPTGFRAAQARGISYHAFRDMLILAIRLTPVKNLPDKIESFEKEAKTDFKLKVSCKTADKCMQAIDDSDLAGVFYVRAPDLAAALEKWTKP